MYVFVCLLLTTLLLGGCTAIDREGLTPTADLVSEVTPTEEKVQSPVPSAAVTATPAFTSTPSVSLTATIAALLTRLPTRTPTPSPEPSPLPDTDMIALIKATVEPQMLGSFLSPDGQWLAEVVLYECTPVVGVEENAYEEVQIVAVGEGTEQVVDTQLQSCGGLGAFGFVFKCGFLWR